MFNIRLSKNFVLIKQTMFDSNVCCLIKTDSFLQMKENLFDLNIPCHLTDCFLWMKENNLFWLNNIYLDETKFSLLVTNDSIVLNQK